MSTKATLAYGEGFHLYDEMLDTDGAVYLTLDGEGVLFEADPGSVTVRIPLHVWEHIRHRGGFHPHYHAMDDAALLRHCTREVDERIANWEKSNKSGLAALCGSAVYGLPSDPREQQIDQGLAWMTKRRAEEQAILAKVQALATKDPPVDEQP